MTTGVLDCPQAVSCVLWDSWFRVLACQRIGAAADAEYHAFPEQSEGTSTAMAVLLRPSPVRAVRESSTNLVFQIFPAMIVKQLVSPQQWKWFIRGE